MKTIKFSYKKFVNQIFIALGALLVIAFIFAYMNSVFEEPKVLALSELVAKINNGEVSKIVIKNDDLDVTLKNNDVYIAKKEVESSLTDTLKNYGVDGAKLAEINIQIQQNVGVSFWVGTILPMLLPFLLVGFLIWFMMRQANRANVSAFGFGKSQAKLFGPFDGKKKVMFSDVAGANEAKEELIEVVDFLKNSKKFLDIGARIPRGVLLVGAPGTGKTLLARAIAGEANVPFFYISGSEFVEMFVGVGASRVRDLFNMAKKFAPSIIFIDEIDAVGRQRGAGLGGGHDEREQTLNQILVEMDGFDRETNVIIVAATNRPDILDPALLRPGRFDRRIVLDIPDINDREAILKIHSLDKPMAPDIDFRRIAERTPGFSGADLANVINEGAILTARQNKKAVDQETLYHSIEKVLLGPERRSHLLSTKEKEIASYHEAGHALIAGVLPHSDPVHKISIVSRGRAAGYTLKLPLEDRHLHSKNEFLADMAVLMGGYAAEKIVFKELTTGASDDLRKATDLARRLVTEYGMSEKFGPIAFGESDEMIFLGRDFGSEKNYSESVAQEIDKEVKNFLFTAYDTAKKIIAQRRKKLKEIAERLIEKETIERDEFNAIMVAA
ncbi:MAG: ATP-dependent zinc metalloprotease FtsH [Candidatus Azambacteria bacterium GW2011_GWE1_42_9]|nr:MAG: ATP-dependent zinc metalloprotease FtsH [Candidatus Azambacteria bacterium GW2011_GWF1_41_10]KKS49474.1 MAG: ATP-dependent zinc metalloprotease FtsH [Candidatus Azambacteria bacterium GW2011_GWF2_42_22]KKS79342.1 MAG: ATP-dependent zinc metalloprotease FtsH [Candidatus Azambacteria bacterium GW2011_GWE1_42_9]KKT03585.1 MAG: ATP-dependent zinc metalloprotease FtsH [Candidatus Azambacteria bacterium GW2011_GWD1_43_18]KKT12739.1 MAG: ATP-dependent zinc metalloprotease FtsH [Candidatus Azam